MKQTKLKFPEKLPTAASEKPNPTSKILIATTGQIPTINLEDLSTEELLKQQMSLQAQVKKMNALMVERRQQILHEREDGEAKVEMKKQKQEQKELKPVHSSQ